MLLAEDATAVRERLAGATLEHILATSTSVIEGIETAGVAIVALAERHAVDMLIVHAPSTRSFDGLARPGDRGALGREPRPSRVG
ncbi:MAG: hypothetical protein U0575_16985 [Phycisphaerales bacterium]